MKRGKVLVLWHKKLGIWLYPGGHVDEGEMPHEAAVRETMEETGFRVDLLNPDKGERLQRDRVAYEMPRPFMILYEHVPYKTGRHDHFDMVYLAKIRGRQRFKTEGARLRWVSRSEIEHLKTYENVKWVLKKALA